jgi:hypothetical protein
MLGYQQRGRKVALWARHKSIESQLACPCRGNLLHNQVFIIVSHRDRMKALTLHPRKSKATVLCRGWLILHQSCLMLTYPNLQRDLCLERVEIIEISHSGWKPYDHPLAYSLYLVAGYRSCTYVSSLSDELLYC